MCGATEGEIEFDCALRGEVVDTFRGGRLCCILARAAFSFRFLQKERD
jgi:hypothetical protein